LVQGEGEKQDKLKAVHSSDVSYEERNESITCKGVEEQETESGCGIVECRVVSVWAGGV